MLAVCLVHIHRTVQRRHARNVISKVCSQCPCTVRKVSTGSKTTPCWWRKTLRAFTENRLPVVTCTTVTSKLRNNNTWPFVVMSAVVSCQYKTIKIMRINFEFKQFTLRIRLFTHVCKQ